MLTVTLNFRRRTLFFSFNLILPTLIITVCTTFGFLLPPGFFFYNGLDQLVEKFSYQRNCDIQPRWVSVRHGGVALVSKFAHSSEFSVLIPGGCAGSQRDILFSFR